MTNVRSSFGCSILFCCYTDSPLENNNPLPVFHHSLRIFINSIRYWPNLLQDFLFQIFQVVLGRHTLTYVDYSFVHIRCSLIHINQKAHDLFVGDTAFGTLFCHADNHTIRKKTAPQPCREVKPPEIEKTRGAANNGCAPRPDGFSPKAAGRIYFLVRIRRPVAVRCRLPSASSQPTFTSFPFLFGP